MEFNRLDNFVYILLFILVLIFIIYGTNKKDKIKKMIGFKINSEFKLIKNILMIIGMFLIFFSLLDPQMLKGFKEVDKLGLDVFVLIDVSKSMLAEDIKPSRLKRTKESVTRLIDSLQGDRVGFIPFSSDSYIQLPLTDDYDMAKMFLEVIDTNMISGGGTDIGSAISLANDSFEESSIGDKVIIVFSDGEEHDNNAEKIVGSLENVKIFTVGAGTTKGGLIPLIDDYGNRNGFKKDNKGNYINSKLKPKILKKIAEKGNGKFYISTIKGDEMDLLVREILRLKRGNQRKEKIKEFVKLYQYFLGLGIILFSLGYLLPEELKKLKK